MQSTNLPNFKAKLRSQFGLTGSAMPRQLLAIAIGFAVAPLAWGQLPTPVVPAVLLPYTMCSFSDGLAAVSVDHLSDVPMSRSVKTRSGTESVSVSDGFRVMLAYPNTDYFVNLKIELSIAGQFARDKQHIIEQMQEMAAQSSGRIPKVEQTAIKGIDVYGLNNLGIDKGGAISFYTLFEDARGIVVTAYILNGDPQHRAFQSMKQYQELRDRFLSAYVSCMAKNRT